MNKENLIIVEEVIVDDCEMNVKVQIKDGKFIFGLQLCGLALEDRSRIKPQIIHPGDDKYICVALCYNNSNHQFTESDT